MPDMSDYLHNKRVALLKYGKQAADSNKFRAPTRDTVYNPHMVGIHSCGDASSHCNVGVKHNTFAAQVLSANPTHTTG